MAAGSPPPWPLLSAPGRAQAQRAPDRAAGRLEHVPLTYSLRTASAAAERGPGLDRRARPPCRTSGQRWGWGSGALIDRVHTMCPGGNAPTMNGMDGASAKEGL